MCGGCQKENSRPIPRGGFRTHWTVYRTLWGSILCYVPGFMAMRNIFHQNPISDRARLISLSHNRPKNTKLFCRGLSWFASKALPEKPVWATSGQLTNRQQRGQHGAVPHPARPDQVGPNDMSYRHPSWTDAVASRTTVTPTLGNLVILALKQFWTEVSVHSKKLLDSQEAYDKEARRLEEERNDQMAAAALQAQEEKERWPGHCIETRSM